VKLLDASDLPAHDAKAQGALRRYTLSLVTSAADPAFAEAHAALDAEFGAKGELETLAAIHAYLAAATPTLGYKLVVARDERGALAGVRDCHVSQDAGARLVIVFLSHVVVASGHRRSGLASLLREVPAVLGRRAAADLGEGVDVMLAAEMEPFDAEDPATVVRLYAYGRAGFKIVDPRAMPYCQPDYREHARIDATGLRPVPLLAVVRWIGHEGARELPKRLAAAFVEHLYRIVGAHCRQSDLAPPRAHTLGVLAAWPGDTAPLLDAPASLDDARALAPLSRDRVLGYYPPSLLGATRAAP
jgi:hypothetical protein